MSAKLKARLVVVATVLSMVGGSLIITSRGAAVQAGGNGFHGPLNAAAQPAPPTHR